MSQRPIIITGCGRSGTHWLGYLMRDVFGKTGGAHEPNNPMKITDVVVDGRLRTQARQYREKGHEVIHLVRDGRDVVRSLYTWYGGGKTFEACCSEWIVAVELMREYRHLRLEDLTAKADPSKEYLLKHHTKWSDDMTETFWKICGKGMKRYGYE